MFSLLLLLLLYSCWLSFYVSLYLGYNWIFFPLAVLISWFSIIFSKRLELFPANLYVLLPVPDLQDKWSSVVLLWKTHHWNSQERAVFPTEHIPADTHWTLSSQTHMHIMKTSTISSCQLSRCIRGCSVEWKSCHHFLMSSQNLYELWDILKNVWTHSCYIKMTHSDSFRSGTTWGWVNDDRIFTVGWTHIQTDPVHIINYHRHKEWLDYEA